MTRAALRNGYVRRLIGGFGAVTVGEWVLGTTVAIHAYAVGGTLLVGLVGFRFVPAALAGLVTVQLAESHRRERLLTVTALTRAAASGLVVVSFALGLPFAAALVLVWLDAMVGSAYRPAQAALLPSLVRTPSELTAATALASNAKFSSQVLGALAGGVLVASVPVAPAVSVATALYALAALTTAGIRVLGPAPANPVRIRERLRGTRAALGAVAGDFEAQQIVAYACLRSLLRGAWTALGVVAALRLLGLGRAGFGILMAAAGAGALGSIPLSTLLVGRRRLGWWLAAGLMASALAIAAIGASASGLAAVALMVGWGLGMGLADVAGQALLNRVVPAASIARVTGLMESGKLLFEGGGSLAAPLLVTLVGIRGGLIAAGAAVALLVAAGVGRFSGLDRRAVDRVGVIEVLAQVSVFRRLAVDALEGVSAQLTRLSVPAGREVITQGDRTGTRWYLVERGELEVLIDGYLVNELRDGDGFGELALLREVPRGATVRARGEVALLSLERDAFLEAVAGRAYTLSGQVEWPGARRQDDADLLGRTMLLRGIERHVLEQLARGAVRHGVDAGRPIVTEGEREDSYHVLLSGRAVVFVGSERRTVVLPGDGFGEIAVLHNVPRSATVMAEDACELLSVSGDAIRAVAQARGGRVAELAGATPTPNEPKPVDPTPDEPAPDERTSAAARDAPR